jgi:hypothetical protein
MFRPQTAVVRCFVYAKIVAMYKMYKSENSYIQDWIYCVFKDTQMQQGA